MAMPSSQRLMNSPVITLEAASSTGFRRRSPHTGRDLEADQLHSGLIGIGSSRKLRTNGNLCGKTTRTHTESKRTPYEERRTKKSGVIDRQRNSNRCPRTQPSHRRDFSMKSRFRRRMENFVSSTCEPAEARIGWSLIELCFRELCPDQLLFGGFRLNVDGVCEPGHVHERTDRN